MCDSLEELRFSALSDRIDGDLAAGRQATVVEELTKLIAVHPLRERLHCQLVLVLHRCGRRAEALDAYRRARRLLVDELGTEPGPQLRRLEALIVTDHEAPAELDGVEAVGLAAAALGGS